MYQIAMLRWKIVYSYLNNENIKKIQKIWLITKIIVYSEYVHSSCGNHPHYWTEIFKKFKIYSIIRKGSCEKKY